MSNTSVGNNANPLANLLLFAEQLQGGKPGHAHGASHAQGSGQAQVSNKASGPEGTGSVGAGNAAGVQHAPDAAQKLAVGGTAMMASVMTFMASLGAEVGGDMSLKLQTAASKLKDTITKTEGNQIKNDQKAEEAAAKAKEEKLKDAQKKREEAADKAKHASIWDKVKLAFSFLGAALAMVAGAIMIATLPVVGQVAGAMLIAGGAVMMVMAIDQAVAMSNKDGMGMFAQAAYADEKRRNPNESDADCKAYANKVSMGVNIALMVVSIAASLPSMFLGTGEEAIASDVMMVEEMTETGVEGGMMLEEGVTAGEDAMEFAGDIENVADESTESVGRLQELKNGLSTLKKMFDEGGKPVSSEGERVNKLFQKINKVVDKVMDGGNAMATTGSDVENYQASTLQADAKTTQAASKKFQALEDMMESMIDMCMQTLKQGSNAANAMVGKVAELQNDQGQSLSHFKF